MPPAFRFGAALGQREYLVGGQLLRWEGAQADVSSPLWEETPEGPRQRRLGSTPQLTSKEALAALDAAVAAWANGRGAWPRLPAAARIGHVERLIAAMKRKRAEVVKLLMWEIAKVQKDAEEEFDRTIDYLVETIAALREPERNSTRFLQEQGSLGQVRRVPPGVALCMGPYNDPLNETFSTMFPALLTGNTVVFKPAKFGVLLVQPLLEAFRDRFPRGVVNVIYGRGKETVGALMESGKVDVLAFIGTHKGAAALKHMHPRPHRLKFVPGLDAKNLGVVLEDADLDEAVSECVAGALSFNGERCTALKLLLVQRTVADRFVAKLCGAVSALKAGLPWQPGVALTPLPEEGKTAFLGALVADAVAKGARVMNEGGGKVVEAFFAPAVVYPVTKEMRLWQEEQLGPVVPIAVFDDDQQAIDAIVDSVLGQQGTLSVADALRVFSIRTLVATKTTPAHKAVVRKILNDRRSAYLSTDYLL